MNKTKISIIIGAISLAVIGLIAIQFYWMNHAIEVQERLFDENVRGILESVSKDLERKELQNFIVTAKTFDIDSSHYKFISKPQTRFLFSTGNNEIIDIDSMFLNNTNSHKPSNYTSFSQSYSTDENEDSISIKVEVSTDGNIYKDETKIARSNKSKRLYPEQDKTNSNRTFFNFNTNKSSEKPHKSEAIIVYEKFISDLMTPAKRLSERIDEKDIKVLLTEKLGENNIDIDFNIKLVKEKTRNTFFLHNIKKTVPADFKVRLYPNDPFFRNNYLEVNFPEKKSYVLEEVIGMMILSMLLIVTLISCFGYTIFTLFKQKKLSDLKNDFINNMTHELKTPISTISLACEGLSKPDISEKPKRLKKYANVISEENKRLSDQVTKILQMAVLDRSEFSFEQIDFHKLVNDVKKSFQMRVEEKSGIIEIAYQSIHKNIEADLTHFKNMLNNLVDNAIKYCDKFPKIKIEIKDFSDSEIEICISDNGIGLSKEEQEMVFEKFYRVSTGDQHDVKGFGLGLSYVKVISDAHHGQIELDSKKGVGTSFKIRVPINQNGEQK